MVVAIHTFTDVLVVGANSFPIIDEWPFSIEICAWSIRQCLVV